jgi:GAF domain-containing protein
MPVYNGAGVLLGVLDLDSNTPAAFTQQDVDALTEIMAKLFHDAG